MLQRRYGVSANNYGSYSNEDLEDALATEKIGNYNKDENVKHDCE